VSVAAGPSLRVLIGDDHQLTREEIHNALDGNTRFEICAEVTDAPAAIQAAIRGRPDICLLDIRLPGGGLATAREIRARLPETKIVMLTFSDDDADLFGALRAGVDGYLLKTMNMKRLPETLNGVFAGEAAMPRALVARVLERFRQREPSWRQAAGDRSRRWRLTSREWEVLDLLAYGRSTAEIADRLAISSSAVRAHISSIVRKLRVPSRAAAVELLRRRADTLADSRVRPGCILRLASK
jgi:DNA-binding NarL/FixJ family response regulator